jgi:hypothetical protein
LICGKESSRLSVVVLVWPISLKLHLAHSFFKFLEGVKKDKRKTQLTFIL